VTNNKKTREERGSQEEKTAAERGGRKGSLKTENRKKDDTNCEVHEAMRCEAMR
jgi:hypothetical protein